jgi:hypothetical protein
MPEGLDQAPAAGVSVASAPHPPAGSHGAGEVGVPGTAGGEACPLCGAPLHPEQEWCLRCGAAARTRLAASSNWKAPIIALAVVGILSLGVLAAALVKLAGGFSSTTNVTRTIAGGPASVTSPAANTPAASTPSTAPPVALVPFVREKPTTVVLKGAVNPQGVPTTYQFQYGTSTRYGNTVPGTPLSVGAGTAAVGVGHRIEHLAPRTTYHYRLTATKAGHAISTADATFTTPR